MSLQAKVWPNGEFSVTYERYCIDRNGYESNGTEVLGHVADDLVLISGQESNLDDDGRDAIASDISSPDSQIANEGDDPRLGLSDVLKNHTRRRRGLNGLTSYARKMLRNGAFVLSERCPRSGLGMLTVTLPPMAIDDEIAAVAAWPEIMRQFLQWISRRLHGAQASPWVVGCCEVQEKRMRSRGGLPLHAHLLMQTRTSSGFVFTPREVREKWQEVVERCANLSNEYRWESSTKIETIRKSAESYISKYVSKGISSMDLEKIDSRFEVPRCWWYAVGGIKKRVSSLIVKCRRDKATLIRTLFQFNKDLFVYQFEVVLEPEISPLPIAWVGKFNKKGRSLLKLLGYNDAVPRD